MNKLFKIELKKIFSYNTFWACAILYGILLPLLFTSVEKMNLSVNTKTMALKFLYNFPELWHNLVYFSSWFNILLYLLIILLITNEFMFKTIRQNIIDGLSKTEVIISKLLLIFLFAGITTIFQFILGTICGFTLASSISQDIFLEKINYLLFYFIQVFGYMTFALFIGLLFKRQGISIIFFLLYSMIIEGIIRLRLPENIGSYLPLELFSSLISNPFAEKLGMIAQQPIETTHLFLAAIYIFIFSGLSILILEKSDI